MKKNRVLIIFIAISVLIFGGLIFSVYKMTSKDAPVFYADGYVSVSTSESSEKVYFNGGTTYRNAYNNKITFNTDKNEKVEVNKYNFVLYNNKSIGFLSNGVIMDADKLNETFIPYYNIKNNYVIEYKDGKYLLAAREKDIIMNNFIGRIDDSKYIVAGNNLRLKVSSSEDYITGYYFELIFSEGNVVKIDNDTINLETISDEAYILIGDHIKLDLSKQTIMYDDEVKVNLSEIIIDNDSNIDIVYDGVGGGDGDGEGDGEGNTSGGGAGEGENNETTNNVSLNPGEFEYKTETVTEYRNIPYVELVSSNVNAHKIDLGFKVIDSSNLITGPVSVRIYNKTTENEETREFANFSGIVNYVADGLTSNSSYIITIYASYIREEKLYRDYIMFQRSFDTTDLGIALERDYVTSSEISYNVRLDSNATFIGATLNLYDSEGNLVASKDFENVGSDVNITFEDLNSNTKYTAKVENVNFGTVRYISGTAVTSTETTLKHNPFKDETTSSPLAKINKKDYEFTFDLGKIDDKNSSIIEVRYDIIDKETGEIVKTITRSDTNQIKVKIDDEVEAHKTYYYNATVTLNDGEKIVNYKTLDSNDFNIDNKINPTMQFIENAVEANLIDGYYKILDPDNAIDVEKDIYVEYFAKDGEVKKKHLTYATCPKEESETTKCAGLSLIDLKSSDIYTINLFAYVDLQDEEIEPDYALIGGVKINTKRADVIETTFNQIHLNEEDSIDRIFEMEISLHLAEDTSEIIAENINGFDIMLYEGDDATGMYISTMHVTAEKAKQMFEGPVKISIKDFNFSLEKLQQLHILEGKLSKSYSIKLRNGSSGTSFVEFKEDIKNFDVNEAILGLVNSGATIKINPILNSSNNPRYDKNLNKDTIIGLRVTTNFGNKQFASSINYTIYDVTDNRSKKSKKFTQMLNLSESSVVPDMEFYFADTDGFLKRGRSYYIEYTVSLDLNNDGKSDLEYPFSDLSIKEANPVVSEEISIPKQAPTLALFPWTSTGNSVVYKYSAVDVDESLPNNFKVGYQVEGSAPKEGTPIVCSVSDNISNYKSKYLCVNFTDLQDKDLFTVYVNAFLYEKSNTPATRVDINNFEFEGKIENLDSIGFDVALDEDGTSKYTNMLSINVSEAYDNLEEADKVGAVPLRNRIAYYVLTLEGPNNTKFEISNITSSLRSTSPVSANVIKYYTNGKESKTWTASSTGTSATSADTGLYNTAYVAPCVEEKGICIFVDYSKLYNSKIFGTEFNAYKNNSIKATLSAVYDTGKVGYLANNSKQYTFQVKSTEKIQKAKVYNDLYFQTMGSRATLTALNDTALGSVYGYLLASANGFVDDGTADNNDLTGMITFANLSFTNLSILSSNTNGNTIDQKYTITHRGVETTFAKDNVSLPIVAKELGTAPIPGEKTFMFDKVVPAINVLSRTSTVNGAKFNLQISGLSEEDVKFELDGNKYLFLEAYDEDNNKVKEIKVNKENLTSQSGKVIDNEFRLKMDDDYKIDITLLTLGGRTTTNYNYDYKTGVITFNSNVTDNTEIVVSYRIVLDGLNNDSNYTLKAYMHMGASGHKTYLVDMSSSTYADFAYKFNTKAVSTVSVTGAKFDMESKSDYKTRYLKTSYSIDDIVGLDNFIYEICNSDKSVCVDVSKYIEQTGCYNKFDYSCISKESNKYGVKFTHDISITNSLDFIYNENYNLVIKAKVKELSGTNTYTIYDNSLHVRELNNPTISVVSSSHHRNNNYYLTFDVSFNDPDRVVSIPDGGDKNGYYVAYLSYEGKNLIPITDLKDKDGNNIDTKQYINLVKDGNDYTATLTFGGLEPNKGYNLMIEYRTYRNNKDLAEKNTLFQENYLIYTLDDNEISIGISQYTATMSTSTLKFGFASNITRDYIKDENNNLIPDPNQEAYVAGISYTITRPSGDATFQINGSKIFENGDVVYVTGDKSERDLGENYYQITLSGTNYPVAATYKIEYRFYLGGKITEELTTEELCHADSISNHWNSKTNECYKLSNIPYYNTTIPGGAK